MRPFKVLVSAYACRPEKGSEPGVGWNVVRELAKHHQVWVLTRENNRVAIEAELQQNPVPALQFIYCDLPQWFQRLNRRQRLVQLHYYLWQIAAYPIAQKLHAEASFDLVHHVTYVKYWSPSFLSLLPIPLIWGPVGGGEVAPRPFRQDFGWRGTIHEGLRDMARGLAEFDPFVRMTARRSALALATTEETAQRLYQLGTQNIRILSQLGISQEEITQLSHPASSQCCMRFVSIGRLLHWKGFHLGLQAFAQADLPESAEYWFFGDGPERSRLQALAERLGVAHRVKFWGNLSRSEVLQKLQDCLALIHPSLHESGGFVCLEAMAAGRPVICLDLGGPALQVTEDTGFKISAQEPGQTVHEMAEALTKLTQDATLWERMSHASQMRVKQVYGWEVKSQYFTQLYEEILDQQPLAVTAQ